MTEMNLNIWGRDFKLDVVYSCYPGETVTDTQKAAVDSFRCDTKEMRTALDEVKKYAATYSDGEIKAGDIENIFKYVMPESIFIPRTEKKILAVLCKYRFDMEHGIAIVFENGLFKTVGAQDIII